MKTSLRQIGKYELQQCLGRSNICEVWKAYDTQERRPVALKLLSAVTRDDTGYPIRFAHTTEALSTLHHANIASLNETRILPSQGPGTFLAYLVTDYIEGQSLADYLRTIPRLGKIPPGAGIIRIFLSLCLAMEYAHQKGVMHGRIKPTNVIVPATTAQPEPVITDIGLAAILDGGASAQERKTLEALLYIAPEQARGEPATPRSEIGRASCR